MNYNIHGFVLYKGFGDIPMATIIANLSPRVFNHIILFTSLIFGYTIDQHSMIVSSSH